MMDPIYDELGEGYALQRRPDPRIASLITAALGEAATVINVGAGTGSYEPGDRAVQSVEPSEVMIRQRPASAAPCLQASAQSLPFESDSFDAAMAILTIHHWPDWRSGLREMRRVASRLVLLLTFDVETSDFWLTRDYFPELRDLDRRIMPSLSELAGELGEFHSTPVPVPHDCQDGFLGAYWRRPEVYLDPKARRSMSSFASIDAGGGLSQLENDLKSGAWHRRNEALLSLKEFDVGYRLLRWRKS